MKKIFENAVWWSGVVTIGLILGISLQFVKAWTEPTVAPPNGNVGAPINTSALTQVKAGILAAGGLVTNSFQLTTGAGAGKVLTSNAVGNATWAVNAGGQVSGGLYGYCAEATNGNGCSQSPVVRNPATCVNTHDCSCNSGYTKVATGSHGEAGVGDLINSPIGSTPYVFYSCLKN